VDTGADISLFKPNNLDKTRKFDPDGRVKVKMSPVNVPVSMCSSSISQNLGESEEVKCSKCWEMKDHIDKLISELKSTKLIIKLLQEHIHLSSPSTKSQANLTNHVGQNTQVVLHRNKEESYTWEEVGRNRTDCEAQEKRTNSPIRNRPIPSANKSLRTIV
jgi:hypothetical protein